MSSEEIDAKFEKIVDTLMDYGDFSFMLERIPYKIKKEIIEDWKNMDSNRR